MNYLLIAYLLGLFYFSANLGKVSHKGSLRAAWIWFSLIPISRFLFTLFQAGNIRSPRSLALVEIWSNGIQWLLFGISLLCISTALIPSERSTSVTSA